MRKREADKYFKFDYSKFLKVSLAERKNLEAIEKYEKY